MGAGAVVGLVSPKGFNLANNASKGFDILSSIILSNGSKGFDILSSKDTVVFLFY